MAKPDWSEVRTEGRQFWEGLSLGGKVALGIVALGVYVGGGLTWGIVWALVRSVFS